MNTLPQLTELTKRQLVLLGKRERITAKMYRYSSDIAAVSAIDLELIEIEKDKAVKRQFRLVAA